MPDPLAVEELISCKLNNERKLARLITQYHWDIFFSNISAEGRAFLLQGVTENDSNFTVFAVFLVWSLDRIAELYYLTTGV